MIHTVSSDLDTFKTLRFKPGLNILLADKSKGATDRHSRNGAGKTSFVEIVHFLFGANADKDSIFRSPELIPWSFKARIDVGGVLVDVARSGTKPSRIRIQGDTSGWPMQPSLDNKSAAPVFTNRQWLSLLGEAFFDLNDDTDAVEHRRFRPSFRSLFSYFARRQNSGGLSTPTQQSSRQQPWNEQVAVSYLLGLDARIPQEFQEVRTREKAWTEIRKAAKEGDLSQHFGTVADLRTQLTITEDRARRLAERFASFNVVPEYADLEGEASTLTRDISMLNDANTADRELILQLQDTIDSEQPPAVEHLERIYREAGVVLPDTVNHRLDRVTDFHQAVVRNRRAHLSNELGAAEARISARDHKREQLDDRRRQLMGILKSGGALEHYALLQGEVNRVEAEAEELRKRLATAEQFESTKVELDIERANLLKVLQNDFHERQAIIAEAILNFEELSNDLYEKAGSLTISATSNGPKVDVRIDAQRSKGITNMQVFCFDLMLADLAARRGMGPGFLIHDSHLFDGVDERQVAKALQLGAGHAAKVGYQYIVTMNSDALPTDGFRTDFDVNSFVIPTRLTDATDTGGLFGIRFN